MVAIALVTVGVKLYARPLPMYVWRITRGQLPQRVHMRKWLGTTGQTMQPYTAGKQRNTL